MKANSLRTDVLRPLTVLCGATLIVLAACVPHEPPTELLPPTRVTATTGNAQATSPGLPFRERVLSDNALTVTFSTRKQAPPTVLDIRIIKHALDILADESKWNKRDDRTCPSGADKWSVFCALLQATEEVVGSVHYRQPALQAVREVLNEVGGTRIKKHRLMDYNNHADTTLRDIHDLLMTAAERLESQLRERP